MKNAMLISERSMSLPFSNSLFKTFFFTFMAVPKWFAALGNFLMLPPLPLPLPTLPPTENRDVFNRSATTNKKLLL